MKKSILFFLFGSLVFTGFSQNRNKYTYYVDLTQVVDDKVQVNLLAPPINSSEATFYMPVIVPGTYAIADYGRFIKDIKAFDKKGKELKINREDDNTWTIRKANKLDRITYWVDDYYDYEGEGPEIFQPAATNIEEGENFVLNTPGFFGYFKDMKELPFELHVIRDENMYGGTGLIQGNLDMNTSIGQDLMEADPGEVVDLFTADNYDHLMDSPLMYAEADTAIIKVGGTEVLVSSYSPTHKVSAREIAGTIHEVLMAQEAYLDGKLPVDKYAFIFYFVDEPLMSYGALEHSYSSFYYMPEMTIGEMEQQLRDFAAHEFFHIITPLTIHSEEIHRFDFNNPKMSRHLWLYEGVTEYFAGNVQVRGGLIDVPTYIDMLRQKIILSRLQMNDSLAFTALSLGALDEYEDQYYNVYQKGALIGMCLDLKLRSLSGGDFGLRDLVLKLSEQYGKGKYFDDDKLFDIIAGLSYPEIRDFFTEYVEGTTPIPYGDFFALAGIEYVDEVDVESLTMGITMTNLGVDFEGGFLYIQNQDQLNEFGKALGLQDNDILLKINGREIPPLGPSTQDFLVSVMQTVKDGEVFSYTVDRETEDGESEEIELEAVNFPVKMKQQFIIRPMQETSEEQLTIRRKWLSSN